MNRRLKSTPWSFEPWTLSVEGATRGNMPSDLRPYIVRYKPLSTLRIEGEDERLDLGAVIESRDDPEPAALVQ